ncbi:M14 family metallopeptidase [Polaribacter sp. HL-MS24]|uniref:M14 family metallopeptidase n=1 Tax=Polaribacter sp. HL-MS24 TaxID=3077735 RepID=UPI002934190C|nr:M14 family metallopeptidase [Polaribacter sp. HL-MS24]WOC39670.1 M14 family metallopeptidase [Polaribacter sp. HL-MS24]
MKKIIFYISVLFLFSCESSTKNQQEKLTTLFESSKGTETPEYKEIIDFYTKLSNSHPEISLFSFGQTDAGMPLHLVVFHTEGIYNIEELKNSPKNRVLISNGIHPGESDGIDASMLFLRDIVQSDSLKNRYKNSLIAVIPVYNIGGALNRNSHTRANQNGPKTYGFRGNARNYDLNRDFIKQDTKNAVAFAEIFHAVQPDVFIDTHVSNGADYQYAITHLFTQHNKLGGNLGDFIETKIRPTLEQSLQEKGIDISPYVNVWGTSPDGGWSQFYDSPRYSTGYTTLFHTLGMMVETHMLKPYATRVAQTYELLFSMVDLTQQYSYNIKELRNNAVSEILKNKRYPLVFEVDQKISSKLNFKGYEATIIPSEVSNGNRLFYDRTKPFTKEVNYYNTFKVTKEVLIPDAYILQQGWFPIVERLQNNHIEFTRFKKDTTMTVVVQHIASYQTKKTAYEGHYLHYDTEVKSTQQSVHFRKGDLYIPTHQNGIRYLFETLEAEAIDSFFNWNFFDTILQQKEGFSGYVFEDVASDFLAQHPLVKAALDSKMKSDKDFASNPRAQLNFIYQNTLHYEKAHLLLPIYKVFN